MTGKNYNNDYFSYNGVISRKNYLINMLILIALYTAISLVRFESFADFISFKLIYSILIFMADLFKFIIIMSALSVIYRRIADISSHKSYKFYTNMKKLFIILFIFPVLYLFCIRYFFDIIPLVTAIVDMAVIYILTPLGIIAGIIFCIIK